MFTINYKGFYIHCHCEKSECRVNGITCKSLHSAKCLVTRQLIAAHDTEMTAQSL